MTPEEAYQEARRRIAEVREKNLEALDLGDLGLATLPPEIGNLPSLRILALGKDRLNQEDGQWKWEWVYERPDPILSDMSVLSKLTNLTQLDLGQCTSLRDVSSLSKLTNLTQLDLSFCHSLSDVRDLSGLTNLTRLGLVFCWGLRNVRGLSKLTNLILLNLRECTNLEDVRDLSGLTSLTQLDLSSCDNLRDVSVLSQLTNLTQLDLSSCTNLEDVRDLSGLTNLTRLDLVSCWGLRNVRDLSGLTNLTLLNLSFCKSLSDVRDLSGLTNLTFLNLGRCESLKHFEPVRPLLDYLEELKLYGCQFLDLPQEVCGESIFENVIETVRAYYADMQWGENEEIEIKVFVLGNGGVGKTQLCRRLRKEPFDPEVPTTHGFQLGHVKLMINGKKVRLNLWDFGGQDIYHGSHALFLQGQAIFLLLWHPDKEVGDYQEAGLTIRHRPLAYWLDYVRGFAGNQMPVLLIQSQCDKLDQRKTLPINKPDDFRYLRELQFSAKEDLGLDELWGCLRESVRNLLQEHPLPPIGIGWGLVRKKLRSMLEKPEAKRQRTLSQKQFASICQKAAKGKVSSPAELLKYFHRSGVVFYRNGLFQDQIVLDQSWALDAIYSLFHRQDNLQWYLNERKGRFTRQALAQLVWKDFNEAEQETFLSMMESCGICFKVRNLNPKKYPAEWEYIAPELLLGWSDSQDQLLGRLRDDLPTSSIEVNYPFLHEGILRRFLSKIGQLAHDNAIYWKFGCWFFEQKTQSQILIESGLEDDSKHPGRGWITLKAWGGTPQSALESLLKILLEIPIVQQPTVMRSDENRSSSRLPHEMEKEQPIMPAKLDSNIDTEPQIFISYAC
jgi:internalin A